MKSALVLLLVVFGVAICSSSVLKQLTYPPQEELGEEHPQLDGEEEKCEAECPADEMIEEASSGPLDLEEMNSMLEPLKKKAYANLTLTKCTKPGSEGWYQIGDTCMNFFNIPITFGCAEAFCRRRRGHLMSIHSHWANAHVNHVVRNAKVYNAYSWIGAYKKGYGYKWTDHSYFNYEYWYYGTPNAYSGRCVAMYHDTSGKWIIVRCCAMYPFTCSR